MATILTALLFFFLGGNVSRVHDFLLFPREIRKTSMDSWCLFWAIQCGSYAPWRSMGSIRWRWQWSSGEKRSLLEKLYRGYPALGSSAINWPKQYVWMYIVMCINCVWSCICLLFMYICTQKQPTSPHFKKGKNHWFGYTLQINKTVWFLQLLRAGHRDTLTSEYGEFDLQSLGFGESWFWDCDSLQPCHSQTAFSIWAPCRLR